MQLDHAFVRQRMVEMLFEAPARATRVLSDRNGCNDVVLSHPLLSGRDGKLHVETDFDAKLGAGVGGWCLTRRGARACSTPRSRRACTRACRSSSSAS